MKSSIPVKSESLPILILDVNDDFEKNPHCKEYLLENIKNFLLKF